MFLHKGFEILMRNVLVSLANRIASSSSAVAKKTK